MGNSWVRKTALIILENSFKSISFHQVMCFLPISRHTLSMPFDIACHWSLCHWLRRSQIILNVSFSEWSRTTSPLRLPHNNIIMENVTGIRRATISSLVSYQPTWNFSPVAKYLTTLVATAILHLSKTQWNNPKLKCLSLPPSLSLIQVIVVH